jgi:hypothetical protein
MATATQRSRLRLDTGHTATSLDDAEADAIYVRAGEEYSASSIDAGARVIAIQYLLGSASKLNDYTQNNSDEKASQVFDHLMKMLGYWEAVAEENTKADYGGGVRTGRSKRIPRRIKGFPGDP